MLFAGVLPRLVEVFDVEVLEVLVLDVLKGDVDAERGSAGGDGGCAGLVRVV